MDFQKEMTGFYMHSLCLPEKVTKHFNDFVGKILEFKCPGGTDVWHVGLIGSGDKLVIQPGWSDFASSNNVSQNDLLLFKLVGGCTFEVRIFDPFGREKCGDFEGEKDEDKVQEGTKIVQGRNGTSDKTHSRKRSPGQNCNSLPLKKRLKKSDCGSPCQENEKTDCKELHIKEEFLESDGEYEISSVKKINSYVEKIIEEARNDNLLVLEHQTLLRRRLGLLKNDNQSSQNPIDYACVPRCWKVMSIEQKTRANRLALQIQAGNPAFLHLIKQSKRPSIVIPKEFSAKHLQKRSQTFILRLPEKENSWPVKYYLRRDFTNTIEGKPFNKFIEENNLKEGDVCVFELVTTADQISFIVHVSRAI